MTNNRLLYSKIHNKYLGESWRFDGLQSSDSICKDIIHTFWWDYELYGHCNSLESYLEKTNGKLGGDTINFYMLDIISVYINSRSRTLTILDSTPIIWHLDDIKKYV